MRAYCYSFLLAALLLACKASEQVPVLIAAPNPDAPITAPTGTVIVTGKRNTITFQAGTSNQASTAKTDNTGRNASEGANGGHSVPTTTTTNKVPLWALALVALVAAAGGAWGWQRWQARPT